MKPVILFVVGAPGVGKTSIVRELLRSEQPLILSEPPEPKWTAALATAVAPLVFAAGHYRGETFDGGDTVPYSGAKAVLEHWATTLWNLVPGLTIFDGARFSTGPSHAYVKDFAETAGAAVACVHLVAPEATLAARRLERGSNQAPAWIKGATTGARNFASRAGAVEITVNGVAEAAARMRAVIADAAE